MAIIDASNSILGRLSSNVAQRLMRGESIQLVNVENAIMSGEAMEKFNRRQGLQSKKTPESGTKFQKRPDFLVKKVVRGMLPYKTWRGRKAYKNLKCFVGLPSGIDVKSLETVKEAQKTIKIKSMTVNEICIKLGWKEYGC